MYLAVDRSARINGAVLRHHANASIAVAGSDVERPAQYECLQAERSPFEDVVTVPVHRLSLEMAGDLSEGDELLVCNMQWPNGRRCQITTEVVPDAGGWATFDVVLLGTSGVEGGGRV